MPQAAYVLHRRDYQESSLLVDLLTVNEGRVRVIAKGAKRNKNPWRAVLQAFNPLQVEYSGRHDLKTLTLAESPGTPLSLSSHYLYSGFYLNELLQRLLPQYAEVSELFLAYESALSALAKKQDIETVLRWFEWQLLQQLGHAFDWRSEAETGITLDQQAHCYFDPERGFLHENPRPDATPLDTQLVMSLEQLSQQPLVSDQVLDLAQRKLCKLIMREALAIHLGTKPLRSRELFKR